MRNDIVILFIDRELDGKLAMSTVHGSKIIFFPLFTAAVNIKGRCVRCLSLLISLIHAYEMVVYITFLI